MSLGGVRSPKNEKFRPLDLVERPRSCSRSEGGRETRDRRRVSDTGWVIDIIGSYNGTGKLLGYKSLLISGSGRT